MGRLIDVDEVKKRFPIMENDFGMVINDRLHKNLDKIPTVEAISKADMVTILDKIRDEILKLDDADYDFEGYYKAVTDALKIIDKYKAESEE